MSQVVARELVLENFKSFGVKTRIPLKPGFTTISGPNGSGTVSYTHLRAHET